MFVQVADVYDLDWRLLPSISFVESTGGKNARKQQSVRMGCRTGGVCLPYRAIQKVAYSLANSSLYKNKDLDEVLETYNPDAEYARKVKSVMERIAPSE